MTTFTGYALVKIEFSTDNIEPNQLPDFASAFAREAMEERLEDSDHIPECDRRVRAWEVTTAPLTELLDALKAAALMLPGYLTGDDAGRPVNTEVRAAIAKAESRVRP